MVQNFQENDGRLYFITLKNHYEEFGIHAVKHFEADKILQDLFYSGEKNPHMWWNEFERQLSGKFNTYD